jgi:DNA-directed RNA polymerase specialized sigma24 family protein
VFALVCRSIWLRACRMAQFYRETYGCWLDPQDIAQDAMMQAWRALNRALERPSPLGYLRRAAAWAMLVSCREHRSLIRVPHTSRWRGARTVEVVSLDALVEQSPGILASRCS